MWGLVEVGTFVRTSVVLGMGCLRCGCQALLIFNPKERIIA